MTKTNNNNPLTLAIDIGGSKIKMLVLNASGEPVTERTRCDTPRPAVPDAILAAIESQLTMHGDYHRISIGFPGVVIDGVTMNAANLHQDWQGFNLAKAVRDMAFVPVRVANDADIQGYGAIHGHGVELVITLGTGFGSSLFVDGLLVPNLELGHHTFEQDLTYEQLLGQAARKESGNQAWRARLLRAIDQLEALFNPTRILIGGGNAKKIKVELPENVEISENIAGILGGIKLWGKNS